MKRLVTITFLAALSAGCGAGVANLPKKNTNAENKPPASTPAPANAVANAQNSRSKSADSGAKRIAFEKDATWGTENVELAPGAPQKFVVTAKKGQFMKISVANTAIKVKMITDDKVDPNDEAYGMSATFEANGDFVFEARNPTDKDIKSSIRVQIDDKPE